MIIGAAAAAAIGRVAAPTTQVYSVNSANLNGSSQYFTRTSTIGTNTTISLFQWFKTSYTSGAQALRGIGDGSQPNYDWYIQTDGSIRFDISDADATDALYFETLETGYNDGNWHFAHLRVNRSTRTFSCEIDGVASTFNTIKSIGTPTGNINRTEYIGRRLNGGNYFNGSLFYVGTANIDTSSYDSTLYNSGTSPCYNDFPQALKDGLLSFNRIGNFNANSGEELLDQTASSSDLTNNGSTPFTGTGLNVECT